MEATFDHTAIYPLFLLLLLLYRLHKTLGCLYQRLTSTTQELDATVLTASNASTQNKIKEWKRACIAVRVILRSLRLSLELPSEFSAESNHQNARNLDEDMPPSDSGNSILEPGQGDQQSPKLHPSSQVLIKAILKELGRLEKLVNTTLNNQNLNPLQDFKSPPEVQDHSNTQNLAGVKKARFEPDNHQPTQDNGRGGGRGGGQDSGQGSGRDGLRRGLRSLSMKSRSMSLRSRSMSFGSRSLSNLGVPEGSSPLDKIPRVLERLEKLFRRIHNDLLPLRRRATYHPGTTQSSKTLSAKLALAEMIAMVEVVTLVNVTRIGVRRSSSIRQDPPTLSGVCNTLVNMIPLDRDQDLRRISNALQVSNPPQEILEIWDRLDKLIDNISKACPSRITLDRLPRDDETMISLFEGVNSLLTNHVLNFYIAPDGIEYSDDEFSKLSKNARQKLENRISEFGRLLRNQDSRIFALRAVIANRVMRAASKEAKYALSVTSKDIYDRRNRDITSVIASYADDETSQFSLDSDKTKRLHSMEEVVRAALEFAFIMGDQPVKFELKWAEEVFDPQTMKVVCQAPGGGQSGTGVQTTVVFPGLWKQKEEGSYLAKTQVLLH